MKPFSDTLAQLRFGTLSDDLTKALHELTAAVTSAGKPGKLTLVITLKPGKGGQIEVFDDVALKAPKPERGSSILFATPDGNLQREDPRQMTLDGLRSVDMSTGELIAVNTTRTA